MATVRVTLKRSSIGRPKDQKATLASLGLRKINATIEKEATPSIMGMINKVSHLVLIEQL
jgi:large subunit ribosomal protein L30